MLSTEGRSDAVSASLPQATPSEEAPRRSVSLDARQYRPAESASAPELLETGLSGAQLDVDNFTFKLKTPLQGQLQPSHPARQPVVKEAGWSPFRTVHEDLGTVNPQQGRLRQLLHGWPIGSPTADSEASSLQVPETQFQTHNHANEGRLATSALGLAIPRAAATTLHDQVTIGLLLYAISTVFAAGMNTCAKLLSKSGMSIFETLLVRSLLMTAVSGGTIVNKNIPPWGTRGQRSLLVIRGLLGFLSISGIYWSLKLLPLSDATVLQFIAPIFVAILAPLILHENPSRMDIAAIPICVSGVLLIAKPSFLFGQHTDRHISYVGIIVGVGQAFFSAAVKVVLRILGKTESTHVMMLYMGGESLLLAGLLCAAIPNMFRLPKSGFEMVLLIFTGGFGYGSQATMTLALKRVKATAAMALSFIQMVWALILGFLVFSEVPSTTSLLGAALICGCTCLLSLLSHIHVPASGWDWLADCLHGISAAFSSCGHRLKLIVGLEAAAEPLPQRSGGAYERFSGDDEEQTSEQECQRLNTGA
ncbi:hypothetical protein WJX84_012187 [Apatococcus fuscideae]|uniref:EamA domain-containing protein n=1 Tax=Apatococcus fuscideae TaxID=2026836 RepID=A0AAW1T5D3_9CHLO